MIFRVCCLLCIYALGTSQSNYSTGASSPSADTAVILTETSSSQTVSQGVCGKLGEQLWRPSPKLPFSEYLKYEGRADASSKFWVSSNSKSNAVDISGRSSLVSSTSQRLPGLCSNTAPFSTQNSQDTSSKWQITLDVNKQTLTGYVMEQYMAETG